jgi:hypothetical protein
LDVELLMADSDERIRATKRGMFEVSVEITGAVVSRRVFRRIMAAMRDDWSDDA